MVKRRKWFMDKNFRKVKKVKKLKKLKKKLK
jgi:hypothetical protein